MKSIFLNNIYNKATRKEKKKDSEWIYYVLKKELLQFLSKFKTAIFTHI